LRGFFLQARFWRLPKEGPCRCLRVTAWHTLIPVTRPAARLAGRVATVRLRKRGTSAFRYQQQGLHQYHRSAADSRAVQRSLLVFSADGLLSQAIAGIGNLFGLGGNQVGQDGGRVTVAARTGKYMQRCEMEEGWRSGDCVVKGAAHRWPCSNEYRAIYLFFCVRNRTRELHTTIPHRV
jgi:hypothetical protein